MTQKKVSFSASILFLCNLRDSIFSIYSHVGWNCCRVLPQFIWVYICSSCSSSFSPKSNASIILWAYKSILLEAFLYLRDAVYFKKKFFLEYSTDFYIGNDFFKEKKASHFWRKHYIYHRLYGTLFVRLLFWIWRYWQNCGMVKPGPKCVS